MIFVKNSRGGREVNMINTLSKINLSKIGWEEGGSTSIWIMSLNILFFQSTPQLYIIYHCQLCISSVPDYLLLGLLAQHLSLWLLLHSLIAVTKFSTANSCFHKHSFLQQPDKLAEAQMFLAFYNISLFPKVKNNTKTSFKCFCS